MSPNTIKILFLISATRKNKKGLVPLLCRLTYLQKRKQFATGLFINPDCWNSKKQKAFPSKEENDFINTQLSLIKSKVNQAFLMLQVNEINFDVQDIYLAFRGENTKSNKTFLEVVELHNSRMEKLVGKTYAPKYYQKWKGMHTIMKDFIKFTYKKNDLLLSSLTTKFLDDLDYYLKSQKNHKQITINKCIQRTKQLIRLAISEGYLNQDPFAYYKLKRYKKEVVFLTPEELKLVEKHNFYQKRLEQVQDLFIFCCYTGLAYAEMSALKREHIITGYDGNTWISMFRKKTGKQFSVPLLKMPISILNKYESLDTDRALPKISNQKFNSYIKEICEIVGIEKNISHHIARKTFASTVLLYNNVPMEIVSELLGHSKMAITQEHYGKVMQRKLGDEMLRLQKKMNKK